MLAIILTVGMVWRQFLRKRHFQALILLCVQQQVQQQLWEWRRSPGSIWHRYLSFNRKENEPLIDSDPFDFMYGPQLPDECNLNSQLLNPSLIKHTRNDIDECSELSSSSYSLCFFTESSKYRTIDGSCNNIKHPDWGKSNICLRRILPYDYADKISYPRISCTGDSLPNPRLVSNVFHQEKQKKFGHLTTYFMEWGQLLAHDFSLNDIFRTKESGGNFPLDCCRRGPKINDRCISMPVPPGDPFYPKHGVSCVNVVRTIPCSTCFEASKRHHWNQNTAYHDLSLVYGSTEEDAHKIRSGELGMLKVTLNANAEEFPPVVPVEELCVSPRHEQRCYRSGDPRTNQNPLILTLHILLLRYHNFLCQGLHLVNPHWNDEKLYQEARRIAIAQAQMITYGHYLPHVLGVIMEKEGLTIAPGDKYTEYDERLDASIGDEYTTVAARYGHSLVPSRLSEIDFEVGYAKSVKLRNYFYNPFHFPKGQFELIASGMAVDRLMKHDPLLTSDVRNYLYRRVYLNETTGPDLAAISIARGRDHGIPGYTYYVAHFFNITVKSFDDLTNLMPLKSVKLLKSLYKSVHDIDLYSAGLAEYHVKGGFVGPTFGAILGRQYKRLKYGDRYWFEHKNQAGSFAPEQLLEIKRTKLSRIICETTDIKEIQERVFIPPSLKNPIMECSKLGHFNFHLWKE